MTPCLEHSGLWITRSFHHQMACCRREISKWVPYVKFYIFTFGSAGLETPLLCHGMQRLRSCPSVQREAKMTGKSVLWIKVLTAMCIIILPRRFGSAVTGEEEMKNWKPSGKYLFPVWNEYVLGEHKNSAHFAKRGAELKITVRVRMERIYCLPPSFSSCFPILPIRYGLSNIKTNMKF